MVDHPRTARPGGRTARTRTAVHDAVRTLLTEPGATVTIPAVAARSGVNATTIYRRWHTLESLLLDVTVEDVKQTLPVPATGDLRADLTAYVHQLLTGLRRPENLRLFRALLAAAAKAETVTEVAEFISPRVDQFQAMLTAAGVTAIDGVRLTELVLAPAYLWAQLGVPLDPDQDTDRIVGDVIALSRPR